MTRLGQTKEEITPPADLTKPKINTDKAAAVKPAISGNEPCRCACCQELFPKYTGSFTPTNFPLFSSTGYYPVCKKCTDNLFLELTDFFEGSEEKAIEAICMMYGLYFHESPLAASLKSSVHRSRIHTYTSKLNQKLLSGKSWLDTLKERAEKENSHIIQTLTDAGESKTVKLCTVKFFGTGFSDDDYIFLQDQYDDWTTRNECKTKAQEEVFKRLCFKQLEILKATRNGDNTKDLDKTYQDLLDTANLKPKQTNMDALSEDRTFGQLISLWENEAPIPEPSPEFEDVDGIGRYISVYFLGHLAKMVGVKNRFSRMYEEELQKYTVQKPEYEEDSEALFDAVFGAHLEGREMEDWDE